jgi:hypothetical protein
MAEGASPSAIRLWRNNIGSKYFQRLRTKYQGYGDTFFIDESSLISMGGRVVCGRLLT